jgi:hypothetical protein
LECAFWLSPVVPAGEFDGKPVAESASENRSISVSCGCSLGLRFVPSSLILWGVGAAHEIHWFGLIVGMCILAFTNACGSMTPLFRRASLTVSQSLNRPVKIDLFLLAVVVVSI